MSTESRHPPVPLNLRQIEVFHAIMLAGSLSDAARHLHVSQPAVSRVLATAEQRLRFLLFERVKGRLLPTPEARRLFLEVESIIDGVRRFNSLAAGLAEGEDSAISVVSSPSYSEWLIPVAIRQFRMRHSSVRVKYRPLPFDSLWPHLVMGHADFAIASMLPPESSSAVAKAIGTCQICCAIPVGHPLASAAFITPDALHGHAFIGFGQTPFGQITERFLGQARQPVATDIEVRSTPEAMALVRQGVGIALVEAFGAVKAHVNDVILRPIQPAISHRIYQVHAADRPLSAQAKGFMATVRNVLKQGERQVSTGAA